MSFERIHRSKSQSQSFQSSFSKSPFAPRSFPVVEPKHPPTQEDIENEAFQEHKFEAFGLQLKEKYGTITPVEQEKLGVLQAKMDDFWSKRMETAKQQPNILDILIRNAQSAQTSESQAPIESNTLQAKSDPNSDRPESSRELGANKTGLPDELKAGVENLSGYSLDDVKVHYNSPKPAEVQALAYTQGTDIHIASGQEEHLPHEAWHVVQQKQGRVKPQSMMMGLVINGEGGLEREADVMGGRAKQMRTDLTSQNLPPSSGSVIQNMTVIQMARSTIALPGMPIDLAGLEAAILAVDREIAELQAESSEIELGFIDFTRITTWRTQFDERMSALRDLAPGATTLTKDEIISRATPIQEAFHAVFISLANLRGTLNQSLSDYNKHKGRKKEEADLEAEIAGFKSKKSEKEKSPEEPIVSPYASLVDTFDPKLFGGVVLVEGNFVVVVEHYQLKHNPDLGILQAGGPFKGKKGSQLKGGWEAHKKTYAPLVLAYAKELIAKYDQEVTEETRIAPAKARLADIDAYLSITRDGNDWVITYHGNPPD